jgi:hypothetical protein
MLGQDKQGIVMIGRQLQDDSAPGCGVLDLTRSLCCRDPRPRIGDCAVAASTPPTITAMAARRAVLER